MSEDLKHLHTLLGNNGANMVRFLIFKPIMFPTYIFRPRSDPVTPGSLPQCLVALSASPASSALSVVDYQQGTPLSTHMGSIFSFYSHIYRRLRESHLKEENRFLF